jgi:uncharacterized cupin superfamily protein
MAEQGKTMLRQPALDPASLPEKVGSTSYPADLAPKVAGRVKRVLGDTLGLTHFGVNLVRLRPGGWSALRHWHSHEDEFVYVLEGELTLVTEGAEQRLGPGMVAGFPAGRADGHHLVNRNAADALYLEVGDRRPDEDDCFYPDEDLVAYHQDGGKYRRKDGRLAD